jgi:hypothetical protein
LIYININKTYELENEAKEIPAIASSARKDGLFKVIVVSGLILDVSSGALGI